MHHHRRKSGHGHNNTSSTDVRRAAVTASDPPSKQRRPGMTRRQTPVSSQKLGRSHREREKELEYRDSWHDERESFPQFCMTCEKQFVPFDEKILYCSETCRRIDQQSSSTSSSSQRRNHSTSSGQAMYSNSHQEPRDIVPRASPSRPNSMYFAHSPPASPDTTSSSHHISALAALRSLTLGPPSPPSPPSSNNGGSLWRFSKSLATSPGNSYNKPSTTYLSSTYGNGYSYGYESSSSNGVDHPLPTRHPGYSRPKSIELVTPVHGR